jgi:hypothetical protein
MMENVSQKTSRGSEIEAAQWRKIGHKAIAAALRFQGQSSTTMTARQAGATNARFDEESIFD